VRGVLAFPISIDFVMSSREGRLWPFSLASKRGGTDRRTGKKGGSRLRDKLGIEKGQACADSRRVNLSKKKRE